MPRHLHSPVLAVLALGHLAAGAAPARAQTEIEIVPRSATITVGGRFQPQFQASSVDGVPADLFIRRARLRLDIEVSDFITARLNPDFVGGTATLQDAYVRLAFDPAFRLTIGQFKRAFSVFELSSSTDLPVVERDGRIAGVSVCPGVGGVCSFSRLTEKLEFDGRDQGVRFEGGLGGGVSYMATVTNGQGINTGDVNDGKSFSGRMAWDRGDFTIGAFAAVHDRLVETDAAEDTEYHPAAGVDVEIGTWRDGFHLLAAAAVGENWAVDGSPRFTTFQALGSYYVGTDGARLSGFEPLLRVGWADPDADVSDNAGLLVTPGFMIYFGGKNGISFNLDAYSPGGDADTEMGFKAQAYLYF